MNIGMCMYAYDGHKDRSINFGRLYHHAVRFFVIGLQRQGARTAGQVRKWSDDVINLWQQHS